MGDLHYLRDVPEGTMLFNSDGVLVLRSTFDRLGDYTRSQPTAPSVGRVWKRAHQWSALLQGHEDEDPNWFVWVARECTLADGEKDEQGRPHHHKEGCRELFGRRALIV